MFSFSSVSYHQSLVNAKRREAMVFPLASYLYDVDDQRVSMKWVWVCSASALEANAT